MKKFKKHEVREIIQMAQGVANHLEVVAMLASATSQDNVVKVTDMGNLLMNLSDELHVYLQALESKFQP